MKLPHQWARTIIESVSPIRYLNKSKRTPMKRVCKHCPYRKDKTNWLDLGRTMFNIVLIRNGWTQDCHMAHQAGKSRECYGARKCLEGGNSQIVSLQELQDRPPISGSELKEKYSLDND